MMRFGCAVAALSALATVAGADSAAPLDPSRSAGSFTVERFDELAYLQPAPVLDHREQQVFARGEQLFEQAKCAVCHVPLLRMAERFPAFPRLAGQAIHAYTDLLLHDMGEELADGRPDFHAGPRDWRTPPLWGLGLSRTVNGSMVMLHDGRARNATEAILWHGGEAAAARDAFKRMPRADREALLAFLESI